MDRLERIEAYLNNNLANSLEELRDLCAIPSVSAKGQYLTECALIVGAMLEKRRFKVLYYETGGAPVVVAERKGRVDKTLLFYNHYDVQPAEPLEEWVSPPFQGEIREGKFYARGADDDKGHITHRLFAIDAILDADGELPCNVKFCIEGDEEASGLLIHEFLRKYHEMIRADACIWEFGGVDHRDVPVLYLGLRGVCCIELRVETATRDAHSGLGGSIFPNAAWRLVWALSTLKTKDEEITIDGFRDAVLPLTDADKARYAAMPDLSETYRKEYGIKDFIKGIQGGLLLNLAESSMPSCTINGLTAGYQGEGSKTVLPAKASAKLDFRLVPEQKPEDIIKLLRAHLDRNGFNDVEIIYHGGEAPAKTEADHPFIKLVAETAEAVFGAKCVIVPMSGGSGPTRAFIDWLNIPVATEGLNYPGTQEHSPNENIRLDLYLKGAMHTVRILDAFAVKKL